LRNITLDEVFGTNPEGRFNTFLWVGEKGADEYSQQALLLQDKIDNLRREGKNPSTQDLANLRKYNERAGIMRTRVIARELRRASRVNIRRASAEYTRTNQAILEIQTRPEFKETMGDLTPDENAVVIAAINSRLQQDAALADYLGWDIARVAEASKI